MNFSGRSSCLHSAHNYYFRRDYVAYFKVGGFFCFVEKSQKLHLKSKF